MKKEILRKKIEKLKTKLDNAYKSNIKNHNNMINVAAFYFYKVDKLQKENDSLKTELKELTGEKLEAIHLLNQKLAEVCSENAKLKNKISKRVNNA